jgi:hypothetical protein
MFQIKYLNHQIKQSLIPKIYLKFLIFKGVNNLETENLDLYVL